MANDNLIGKLITFEGIDGAGKTTQIELLSQYLTQNNIPNTTTRQPGGTRLGVSIRQFLLSIQNGDMCDLTELLLYAADRAQHSKEFILPKLRQGITVLCDRFVDSTVAYQGFGRGLDMTTINQLNLIATAGITVAKTIFLDIEPRQALFRKDSNLHDRLELAGLEFYDRVYKGYLSLCDKHARITKIDASLDALSIHKDIVSTLLTLYNEN